MTPDICEHASAPNAPTHPYYVHIEYPVVAYATIEIEAESPEAAIKRACQLHEDGGIPFDLDHAP